MQVPNLSNLKILIVDTEDRNWYLLRDIIEMWNGTALWAESGMQAIDMVKSDPAISMLLVDLNLPFMSGIETTRRIKALRPDIPIVVQTAYAEPEMITNCLKAGCSSYLLKPIDFNKLKMVFIRELRSVQATDPTH
jgi:CheY-like chemotaxis protein